MSGPGDDVIPAVVIAYRRPDLLARALESLRVNAVPLIYAFSDGPRSPDVAADVAAVRALLRAVTWARVEVVEAPANLGVTRSELQGISHALARHEMAVIVEEDLEFVPGTYAWLCAALRHYREEPRVMGVTAWAHPRLTPAGVAHPYFTGRMSGLMWGTWRRAWSGMERTTSRDALRACRARGIDPSRFGYDLISPPDDDVASGTWDLRFNLHMLAHDGLFLFPPTSMVRHTGYDARATNSPNVGVWADVVADAPDPASVRWPDVAEHPGSGALWQREVAPAPPTLIERIRRRLFGGKRS